MRLFSVFVLFALTGLSAIAEEACRIRENSVAYDIEIDWDPKISTKIQAMRIVFGMKRGRDLPSDSSMRKYNQSSDVAIAIAKVQIPEDGIEASDFTQNQFFHETSEDKRCEDKWFCAKNSYTGTLGFESPLEIIPSKTNAEPFEITYNTKQRPRFVVTPESAEKSVPVPIGGMTYNLNPSDIDRNIVDCLAVTLARRSQQLSFVGQCKTSLAKPRVMLPLSIDDVVHILGQGAIALGR